MKTIILLSVLVIIAGCSAENVKKEPVNKEPVRKEVKKRSLFKECKEQKVANSCYRLGKALSGVAVLKTRCTKGDDKSCEILKGRFGKYSVQQVRVMSAVYYLRACNLDHADACMRYGLHHALIGNKDIAYRNFSKSCRLGSSLGCKFRDRTWSGQ
jgi:TPR repeat protein